jgi:hypothetical protein
MTFYSGGGMANQVFFFVGGFIVFFWGVAHLFPTRGVVRGFGEISLDNKRIIAMEWIVEGAALIFIGMLIALVTVIGHTTTVARGVYWLSFVMLNALSVISLFTGFRVNFLPFKLCPVIFTSASILLLLGLLV